LRGLAIAAGVGWAVAFIAVALRFELQLYADGSLFSYAVAARDAWALHWHNISGRLLVYLYALWPAETYVALSGDARGGIALYGLLFHAAPLLGLALTFAIDRSRGRVVFATACASTACLCPLVFGFPTEMWLAHALFWPALAVCLRARAGIVGAGAMFVALLALMLTHEGAVVLAAAIVAILTLRGWRDAALPWAAGALVAALAAWAGVKLALRPDDYFASIVEDAARYFINAGNFTRPVFLLLLAALAAYGIVVLLLRRQPATVASSCAAALVAAALGVYWLWFDRSLHGDDRYALRTVLLVVTPVLGALAAATAIRDEGRLGTWIAFLPRLLAALAEARAVRAVMGAVLLVTLINTVETVKFVAAWTDYKAAVRALAMGGASDPALGDLRFVSSARIGPGLNRLAWSSTTHFLSVLLAPGFAPARLVVDPGNNYVWLSCAMARASERADRAIPVESRRLIRVHACGRRP
jgi:hypothetical protein